MCISRNRGPRARAIHPQMYCPFLDTTLCAMSGALHQLVVVPAMFGTFVVPLMRETLGAFPVVVRIVQVVIGVRVLPPCKARCRVDEIPVLRHDTLCWMEWPAYREISRGNQDQGRKASAPAIKLATGNTIAGLIAGFRMSIFLRFFISNLLKFLLRISVVLIPNLTLPLRAVAKVEGGQTRVMTSIMLSLNARTCLSVRTAARSGPSPKARASTLELVTSINAIGSILRFKAWMV
jgi:hypothetical protein